MLPGGKHVASSMTSSWCREWVTSWLPGSVHVASSMTTLWCPRNVKNGGGFGYEIFLFENNISLIKVVQAGSDFFVAG